MPMPVQSMAAFTRRQGNPLAREVAVALAFKVAALLLLYLAFFGPWQRPEVTTASMQGVLLDAPAAASREERPR